MSVRTKVGPALSSEEWETESHRLLDGQLVELDHAGPDRLEIKDPHSTARTVVVWMEQDRHALAALALHGQSFGFTHEDVDAIRDAAEGALAGAYGRWAVSELPVAEAEAARVREIADRIEALLPPRDP